jgi:hypothetical protein
MLIVQELQVERPFMTEFQRLDLAAKKNQIEDEIISLDFHCPRIQLWSQRNFAELLNTPAFRPRTPT